MFDTAGRWGNPRQLETDVAERGGTWTSWRVVATDHSRLRVMMMMMRISLLNPQELSAITVQVYSDIRQ